jgi:hypothetical protein
MTKPAQQKDQEPVVDTELLQKSLVRLRKRMTYIQDEYDITSHAIRSIETDLQRIHEEDSHAQNAEEE